MSKKCAIFQEAMNQIVAVKNLDIVENPLKMFWERKQGKKTAGKKLAKPTP